MAMGAPSRGIKFINSISQIWQAGLSCGVVYHYLLHDPEDEASNSSLHRLEVRYNSTEDLQAPLPA